MSKLLYNLLMIAGSIALYFLLINPLYTGVGSIYQPDKGITTLKSINDSYDIADTQAKAITDQASAIISSYHKIPKDSLDKMKTMLPDKVDPIRLMSEVNLIINSNGFSASDLGYGKQGSTDGSGVSSYSISFSVKGSYSKFKDLLKKFENSMRIYNIVSLNFNVPPDGPTDQYIYKVNMETYYNTNK